MIALRAKQPVIVNNKPGAGGAVGTHMLAEVVKRIGKVEEK